MARAIVLAMRWIALLLLYSLPTTSASATASGDFVADFFLLEHPAPATRQVDRLGVSGSMDGARRAWLTTDILTPVQRSARFEATTHLILSVGADGRVDGCEILASGLSADQDRQTCAMLATQANFRPRYRVPGEATAWAANFSVRWRTIPRSELPPTVGLPRVTARLDDAAPQWPRLTSDNLLRVRAFPSLAARLPGDAPPGRTYLDLEVVAATGARQCRIGVASGQAALDDLACEIAKSLPLEYARLNEGASRVLPLLFIWEGAASHIRVPLASYWDRGAAPSNFDPLDKRDKSPLPHPRRPRILSAKFERTDLSGLFASDLDFMHLFLDVATDSEGRVTACSADYPAGKMRFAEAGCKLVREWRIAPDLDVFGDPVASTRPLPFMLGRQGLFPDPSSLRR